MDSSDHGFRFPDTRFERLDRERVSRWLQAPILIATFMFGPLGLLLGLAPSLLKSNPQTLPV